MDAATTNAILAYTAPAVATVVTGLAGVGIALLYKKLGLQQTQVDLQREGNASAALQGALVTGAGILATQGKDAALAYVAKSVPDAVAHFGLSPDDIAEKVVEGRCAGGSCGSGSYGDGGVADDLSRRGEMQSWHVEEAGDGSQLQRWNTYRSFLPREIGQLRHIKDGANMEEAQKLFVPKCSHGLADLQLQMPCIWSRPPLSWRQAFVQDHARSRWIAITLASATSQPARQFCACIGSAYGQSDDRLPFILAMKPWRSKESSELIFILFHPILRH